SPPQRRAAYAFSAELLAAGPFWAALWQQVSVLATKPCLIFWGMKDSFVPAYELEKWQKALPDAQVIRLEQAGHFAQEEEPALMVEALGRFFAAP
ncbi:MAG: alpha/beta fold hydrolase, partial [Saprospiraceae bacterium]|nr:alpha/beta fold hydrolase [Saprospiraceae bacterium]